MAEMQLQLQSFGSLVAGAAASVQGAARALVDLSVGSTLRAILEANAAIALWMQWLILRVLRMTRAATSEGDDLDSWVGDFALARLPATPARGEVTFARYVPTARAVVPVGTVVRTGDGSVSFAVDADPAHPAWDGTVGAAGGYALGPGVASVSVMATALVAGSGGNVQPGAVALIAAALTGVDTVVSGAAFTGGLDAESDAALRARFQNYIASRSRATVAAVLAAIASVRQGLQATVAENRLPDGSVRMGTFTVTVDDGTGAPPPSLFASVAEAIEAVRPVGSAFTVQPPVLVAAGIALSLDVGPGAARADVVARVAAAIGAYAAGLAIGQRLAWARLAQLAFDADPAVVNVSGVTINGAAADLVPPASGVVRATSVVVS